MGFFAWIREGVRRAVLLGFSDAVAQLGERGEHEDLGPHLAASLRQNLVIEGESKSALHGPTAGGLPADRASGGSRKRLGKSLEQIREGQRAA